MTGRCRGVASLAGAAHCLVHPEDASRLGVTDRSLVELATAYGRVVVEARISDATPPGQVLVPRGYRGAPVHELVRWPHAAAAGEVKPLVPAAAGGS
jgi:anaerobic selenocysteine-containing dehydrogenase